MTRISTHILDLTRGRPAGNVPVHLDYQDTPEHWQTLASSETNDDGRCPQLISADLQPGVYRLVFETASYFAAQQINSLYPFVEVVFQLRSGESHFHIPLLLSPNGYTTYRGT
jgi:5-hydroxyisourate hydrolase